MKTILLIAVVLCASVCAEEPQAWLDDYFRTINGLDAEADEFVLAKDSSLKDALALDRAYRAADEAMYRYLFSYHIEQKTGLLDWGDGDWTLSIMVCNCGEEGRVPTDEFRRLFGERSGALIAANKIIDREIGSRVANIRRELPREWHDRKRASLEALKSRFDVLVPLEGWLPRTPRSEFVPPAPEELETEDKGRPNQVPEPTSGSVTPRADARVAPPPPVAHR